MNEVLTGPMSRREALRRAALLGGAFAAAAPAVQVVSTASAHAMGSPPPPPPPATHAISFVAFTFVANGSVYKAKWEADGGWEPLSSNDQGLANCGSIGHWATAIPVGGTPANVVPGGGTIAVVTTPHPADPTEIGTVTFTLPAGSSFTDGSAAVKGGPAGCGFPLVAGQSVTFVGNPK